MKDKQTLLRWAGLLCLLALLAPFGFNIVSAMAEEQKSAAPEAKTQERELRADRITLRLSQVEKLELPPVTFFHDKHTKALSKEGKNCESCHSTAKDSKNLAMTFMEVTKDMPYGAAKDYFHKNCVSCHLQTTKAGKPSGPEASQCRSCHSDRKEIRNDWAEVRMDKSLHYRHIASTDIPAANGMKDNCSTCHHVFNAEAKKLVWEKGTEDNCRACHAATASKLADGSNPPALANVSHQSCVSCHYNIERQAQAQAAGSEKKAEANYKTGPYTCEGCHTKQAQDKVEHLVKVPRLERGQPDAILLVGLPSNSSISPKGSMRPVAFDHKRHEAATKDCNSCHHVKIGSCTSCHSLDANEKGKGINLAQAMHNKQSARSCVGCHDTQKAQPQCASCHGFVKTSLNANSCATCHNTPVGATEAQAQDGTMAKLTKEERILMGKNTVATRRAVNAYQGEERTALNSSMPLSEVPEVVTIGSLSKEYEPVKMPHRQIVKALADSIGTNALANGFHRFDSSLCQGCHHRSPGSKTPPSCVSCHGQSMVAPDKRPGLMAAYHQQCMGCHTRAKVAKPANTDCVGCHKVRAKS